MIRSLTVALLLAPLAMPGALAAQTLTLRSGEHPGFTRLVLTLPEPAAWEFGRGETGYVVKLRGTIREIDASTVFRRIPRTRLKSLETSAAEGTLALALGCDCHAIATPFRPGIIVIDIADGPAPAGSPFEEVLEMPASWQSGPDQIRPPPRPRDFVAAPKLPQLGPRRLQAREDHPPFVQRLHIPDVRASLLTEQLSRDLSRGIASGAISAAQPVSQTARTRPVILTAPESPPPERQASPQMSTRAPGSAPSREPPASGLSCIPPSALDLAAWGDGRPAALQLGEARHALLGEFDRPDSAAVLKLARLYLHLGFGAEARALLTSWPEAPAEAPLLQALGRLVDGLPETQAFDGMQGCDGPAALWATLSQAPLSAEGDRAAVLRAFSDLPPWLRRDLAPALSERFLAAGDLSAAQSVEEALIRATPTAGPEAQLLRGQIDLAQGLIDTAEARLEPVARTNGPLAPKALIALVDHKLARGEEVSAEQIAGLEDLLRREGRNPEAPALRRSLARSLVAMGQAERAFETLAPSLPDLYPELWAVLAQRGTDADLARQTLAPPPGSLRGLPAATRETLAERLITAGFPARALSLAEPLEGTSAQLLRARAHLTLRDGRAALRHLAGSDAPGAAAIRAEALELLADYEAAEAAWIEAGDQPRAERLRLLRLDWANLPSSSPEMLQNLAGSLTPQEDLPPEPLARARAQVTHAEALRATALAVLHADRPR